MATARKTASALRRASARPAPVAAPKPAAKAGKAAKAAAPSKAVKASKAAKPAKVPKADKASKADKARKPKLVRDSFTIPKDEYAVLEQLKDRAARAGRPTKKSELLRAGLQALAGLSDAAFLGAVSAIPSLKTGRPAKA